MVRNSICLGIALSLVLLSCTNPTASAPGNPDAPAKRESPKDEPESFAAERARFKESAQYLGKKSAITDAQLQPGSRALIVMKDGDAAKIDLLTVGSIQVQELASGLRVLSQVIAENEKERLIIIQPIDDVLAGRSEVNYAVRDDSPWEKGVQLGKGGQGVAYKWGDFAVKSASDEKEKWKRYLKLSGIEGVIKLRGFVETSKGSPWTFFELLKSKDLSSVTFDEYNRIAMDLFKTLRLIHNLGEEHGDISPKNIMFRGEKPVLIDLGTGPKTPEYSAGVSDDVALAKSLIDLRHVNLFRQNALVVLSKIQRVIEPVAEKIRNTEPEFEKTLKAKEATVESYLTFRFLRAADQAFHLGYAPSFHGVKDVEEWQNKKFGEPEERGTRGLDLLLEKYLRYRDMDCDIFGQIVEKAKLQLAGNLGLHGGYPKSENGHCVVSDVNNYKIAFAFEKVQLSLAGMAFDYDYVSSFKKAVKQTLDKTIYSDLKKLSKTDAMLVGIIQK